MVMLGAEQVLDCLGRSRISLPRGQRHASACLATVASAGFAEMLDDLLESLRLHGDCADASVVVFLAGGDPACRSVAARHGAIALDCSMARFNTGVKSMLYSVAEVIDADRYICLDADMLVLASLQPVLTAVDALPDDAILCCAEGGHQHHTNLESALQTIYDGTPADFDRLLGVTASEPGYPFVVNEGFFAGSRTALLGLATTMRSMHEASAWIDERPDNWWRSQFVFNLALARGRTGVELDPTYNVQLHVQDVDVELSAAGPRALSNGRPVRILHFNGVGRGKRSHYRSLLAMSQPALP
jgi:hypothetical protein